MKLRWHQDFTEYLESTNQRQEVVVSEPKTKEMVETPVAEAKQQKKTEQTHKRNLRRKIDHLEHKIKQMKLKKFEEFKDEVFELQAATHNNRCDVICS